MCLAVPGRVVALEERFAQVSFHGVERRICLDLLGDVTPGEYVLVHAGFAIEKVEPDEAAQILGLLEEALLLSREDGPGSLR